ncbi:MAG TPA: RHS repeat-associated core domain-containing protein [Acidobacteriaceae bacterium]|nr:RHS repeat-associated core domain-containing protein [Acidobacteriaceae bacterium]
MDSRSPRYSKPGGRRRAEHDGPGYTKHEEDAATGLTNMQQRYDDKAVGRMLSMDPMDVDPGAGANFNRYAYADDNPYRYTDPDGEKNQDGSVGGEDNAHPPTSCSTGALTPGGCGAAYVSVGVVDDSYRKGGSSASATPSAQGGQGTVNSSGTSSGSASGQSPEGSSQAGKVRKEWTIQDFNELDKNASNSYAPLFLAPVGLGAGSGAVVVGGPVVWEAAAPYVRPAAFALCLSASIACHGASEELEELPHEFAAQEEKLEEMYEGEKAEAVNIYKQIIESNEH